MRHPENYLRRPLDWVFSARSVIAVIRALKSSAEGMSGRAIAREAGFAQQACRQTFAKLESLGLIKRQGSDKTQLIRLNFEHILVKDVLLPMFAAEKRAMRALRDMIREDFKGMAMTATLFGSVSRNEEEPGSDVDVLLVIKSGSKSRLLSKANVLGRRIFSRYGMSLSPMIKTVREVRAQHRRSDPLLKNILADGIDLLDKRLEDMIE